MHLFEIKKKIKCRAALKNIKIYVNAIKKEGKARQNLAAFSMGAFFIVTLLSLSLLYLMFLVYYYMN